MKFILLGILAVVLVMLIRFPILTLFVGLGIYVLI